MSKTFHFDVETTGTDHNKHAIIQLAFILEIDGKFVEEGNLFMHPLDHQEVTKEALEVNGRTVEEIYNFPDPQEAFKILKSVFADNIDRFNKHDKFFPAGFNIRFDLDFLAEFWRLMDPNPYGLGCYCNWRWQDPLAIIYQAAQMGKINLPNYKLGTCCEHFGIELDNAHDALADIRATIELNKIVRERFML